MSGERIRLNNHASQEKLSQYSGAYGSPARDPSMKNLVSIHDLEKVYNIKGNDRYTKPRDNKVQ